MGRTCIRGKSLKDVVSSSRFIFVGHFVHKSNCEYKYSIEGYKCVSKKSRNKTLPKKEIEGKKMEKRISVSASSRRFVVESVLKGKINLESLKKNEIEVLVSANVGSKLSLSIRYQLEGVSKSPIYYHYKDQATDVHEKNKKLIIFLDKCKGLGKGAYKLSLGNSYDTFDSVNDQVKKHMQDDGGLSYCYSSDSD